MKKAKQVGNHTWVEFLSIFVSSSGVSVTRLLTCVFISEGGGRYVCEKKSN